jgi:hypothetical protein
MTAEAEDKEKETNKVDHRYEKNYGKENENERLLNKRVKRGAF